MPYYTVLLVYRELLGIQNAIESCSGSRPNTKQFDKGFLGWVLFWWIPDLVPKSIVAELRTIFLFSIIDYSYVIILLVHFVDPAVWLYNTSPTVIWYSTLSNNFTVIPFNLPFNLSYYCTLLYSTPLYSTVPYSTLLYTTLLCTTL